MLSDDARYPGVEDTNLNYSTREEYITALAEQVIDYAHDIAKGWRLGVDGLVEIQDGVLTFEEWHLLLDDIRTVTLGHQVKDAITREEWEVNNAINKN